MYCPAVTICTAQWSLYVPPSGHYIYRLVVNICTEQFSLQDLDLVLRCEAELRQTQN